MEEGVEGDVEGSEEVVSRSSPKNISPIPPGKSVSMLYGYGSCRCFFIDLALTGVTPHAQSIRRRIGMYNTTWHLG